MRQMRGRMVGAQPVAAVGVHMHLDHVADAHRSGMDRAHMHVQRAQYLAGIRHLDRAGLGGERARIAHLPA